MRNPARILIADDNEANRDIFSKRLAVHGYDILTANDGEEALEAARREKPDLILLDIMMPKINGIEVCRRLKADTSLELIPIIVVSAKSDPKDVVEGLEAGASEYLTKPTSQTALVARVKSMLRIKELHDQTIQQSERLEEQAKELSEWNLKLEERVSQQVAELERFGYLKRFFPPQIAQLILSSEDQPAMQSHRQEIAAVSCDLRNYTEFAATAEPEEGMLVLQEYMKTIGSMIFRFEATMDHVAGDGVMSFFNDPFPCPDPATRAVRMAVAMQRETGELIETWRKRGFDLGFGVGIAMGYATLGKIEFEGFFQYAAVGSVCNLAARLCAKAQNGQILISQRVFTEVEQIAEVNSIGNLELKGLYKPVPAFNVAGLRAERAEI